MYKDLIIIITVTTLLQVAHCFEEIAMNVFVLYKKRFPKNPRGVYLRAATFLVALNFIIILLLINEVSFAPYLCFYTVYVSLANAIVHLVGWANTKSYKATMGVGVFSGIPLGISGGVLLYTLIVSYL